MPASRSNRFTSSTLPKQYWKVLLGCYGNWGSVTFRCISRSGKPCTSTGPLYCRSDAGWWISATCWGLTCWRHLNTQTKASQLRSLQGCSDSKDEKSFLVGQQHCVAAVFPTQASSSLPGDARLDAAGDTWSAVKCRQADADAGSVGQTELLLHPMTRLESVAELTGISSGHWAVRSKAELIIFRPPN